MSSRPVGLVRVTEASGAWARGQSSLQCATGCPFKNSEAEKDGPTIHGETVAREGSHAKWAGIRRVQHWPLGLVTFLRTQRDGSVWKWGLPERPTHPGTADRSAQGNSPSNSPKVKQKMVHEFRDVQFMSAAEKTRTLRAWTRFLNNRLQFEQFTKGLYNHLIQHCSFIAHYNRAGFYSCYFEAGDSIALFLSQFDSRGPCSSVEYGGHHWLSGDYEDINRVMIAEGNAYIPRLLDAALRRQEATDIAAATALLAKHGISVEGLGKSDGPAQPIREAPKAVQELLPYGSSAQSPPK